MLLTMADMGAGGSLVGSFAAGAGASAMSLYGPPGLSTLAAAVGTFVNTQNMGLQVRTSNACGYFLVASGCCPLSTCIPYDYDSQTNTSQLVGIAAQLVQVLKVKLLATCKRKAACRSKASACAGEGVWHGAAAGGWAGGAATGAAGRCGHHHARGPASRLVHRTAMQHILPCLMSSVQRWAFALL